MKNNTVAIVTTFFPDESFIGNLKTYYQEVDHVYIVDNTNKYCPSHINFIEQLNSIFGDGISILSKNSNIGIAGAVNWGATTARDKGYKYALLLDQDSSFNNKHLREYFNRIEKEISTDSSFFLFGPSIIGDVQSPDTFNKPIMTSGSLVDIECFITLGGYTEKLFIDEVDHEFCLKALRRGYKIKKFGDIFIQHSLGKDVLTSDGSYREYNPFRYYYFVRNIQYLLKNYSYDFPDYVSGRKRIVMIKVKNALRYNKRRFACAYFIIRGYFDAKMNKWGKQISF